jgi:hypothetical protein
MLSMNIKKPTGTRFQTLAMPMSARMGRPPIIHRMCVFPAPLCCQLSASA